MKKKKNLIKILGFIVTVLIIIAVLLYTGVINISNPVQETPVVIDQPIEEEPVEQVDPIRQLWKDNKAINDDYIGEIIFDSGLINKSFVQATTVLDENGNIRKFYNQDGTLASNPDDYNGNDVYIYTNWKDMSYDYNILGGSVFMDYRNTIYDQNIIIYGHHFSESGGNDPERIKAFTPLEKLMDEEYYQDNNIVKLHLANEIRTYELIYVYKCDTRVEDDLESLQYYRTFYDYDYWGQEDEGYYQKYIEACEKAKLYDTGKSLTTDDNTLTLQTCVSGYNGEIVEICVFKLTNTEKIEN